MSRRGDRPEFAAHGKGRVSVGDALAHRAGVPAPRVDVTIAELLDGAAFAGIIAEQEPFWEPGTSHQYHAVTVGRSARRSSHAYQVVRSATSWPPKSRGRSRPILGSASPANSSRAWPT